MGPVATLIGSLSRHKTPPDTFPATGRMRQPLKVASVSDRSLRESAGVPRGAFELDQRVRQRRRFSGLPLAVRCVRVRRVTKTKPPSAKKRQSEGNHRKLSAPPCVWTLSSICQRQARLAALGVTLQKTRTVGWGHAASNLAGGDPSPAVPIGDGSKAAIRLDRPSWLKTGRRVVGHSRH